MQSLAADFQLDDQRDQSNAQDLIAVHGDG